MSTPADWQSKPAAQVTEPADPTPAGGLGCPEPDCAVCVVKDAGARAICFRVGVDYDELDAEHQEHYRTIAGAVMDEMSQAMIATGLARPRETP